MSRKNRVTLHLRIDPVACDAYGYCAELLPEHVTVDDWGYPMLDGLPIETTRVALAKRAVKECPKRALLLERRAASSNRS